MACEKVYIDVLAAFDQTGRVRPLKIRWRDGRTYAVDKILDVRPAPSLKAGGQGQRYTVRIQGQERFLFLETAPDSETRRWFVESAG